MDAVIKSRGNLGSSRVLVRENRGNPSIKSNSSRSLLMVPVSISSPLQNQRFGEIKKNTSECIRLLYHGDKALSDGDMRSLTLKIDKSHRFDMLTVWPNYEGGGPSGIVGFPLQSPSGREALVRHIKALDFKAFNPQEVEAVNSWIKKRIDHYA
jgi:hypothetical protein